MQLDPCLDASSMFDPCQELGRSNPKFHKPNFSNVQETPNKTSLCVWSLPSGNSLRGEHLASNPTDLAALSGLVKPPRLARSNFTTDQSPCFGCLLLLPCEKGKRFPWISIKSNRWILTFDMCSNGIKQQAEMPRLRGGGYLPCWSANQSGLHLLRFHLLIQNRRCFFRSSSLIALIALIATCYTCSLLQPTHQAWVWRTNKTTAGLALLLSWHLHFTVADIGRIQHWWLKPCTCKACKLSLLQNCDQAINHSTINDITP